MVSPPSLRLYLPVMGLWLVATAGLLALVLSLEGREAEKRFRQQANLVFATLQEKAHVNDVVLEGFAAALRSLPPTDDGRVREYARAMLARYPHLFKLAVSPRVPGEHRAAFEAQMQAMGYPDFRVRTFAYDTDRTWRPVPPAEVHYPVAFLEPDTAGAERTILGLDAFSAPQLRAALIEALERNGTASTVPFELTEGGRGYVLFRPVCASYQESCSGEAAEVTPRLAAGLVVLAGSLVDCGPDRSVPLGCALYFDETRRDPAWVVFERPAPDHATALERLLFPSLRFDRQLTGSVQRFLFTASQQLGFRTFNVVPALSVLAVSLAGLTLVLVSLSARARSEREREQAYLALAEERRRLDERVQARTGELSRLNAELHQENDARRAAEERLALKEREARGLARRILEVQEEERRALARELHDDVGQSLTAIRTHARLVRDQAPDPVSPLARSAEAIGAVAADLYDSTHRLMRRLRPRALDDAGLAGAFQSCVAAAELEPLGIAVHLELSGDLGPLDEAVSITLYRALQEALTNVARHAGARNVWVHLARSAAVDGGQGGAAVEEVTLQVRDDGRGIPATRPPSTGFGLVGLRERVETLGGTCELENAPGGGVNLRVRVPLLAVREP
ncbi:MAG: CHASE domain-containing protein [Gammaproteobacteria bacterium]|jgi:signal transduction histidine kinase|nr:CHASE domain-containing protein [Gammaproteobacteria bacterium]